MKCISDHAEVLLIYYCLDAHTMDGKEKYTTLEDATERAKDYVKEYNESVDIYQVRVIQDGNRIFVREFYVDCIT